MSDTSSDDMDEIPEEAEKEMVDITTILDDAAKSLTVSNPMLCNTDRFNLQDAMAALEVMDPKMDCCEIPISEVAPFGVKVDDNNDRLVFPRPVPTGLDDAVDPLPWDGLTNLDAAHILVENMIRLESLLGGASVVESTYTCLYAHKPVVTDMKQRLIGPVSNDDGKEKQSMKGTLAQNVVYASTLIILELTDSIRSIILNADIYEEEDFTVSTYSIDVFNDRDEGSVVNIVANTLEYMVSEVDDKDKDEVDVIAQLLKYKLDLLAMCTTMARLNGGNVRQAIEKVQRMAKQSLQALEKLCPTIERLEKRKPDSAKTTIRRVFDSHVNRPLVGNAPVRAIRFQTLPDTMSFFVKFTRDLDWALCRMLLKGDSLDRIRRMLFVISVSELNILIQSLVVLNLYFDEKIFGQHPLPALITKSMQRQFHLPDTIFNNQYSGAFITRMAKPMYDILKVMVLNRQRQRAYIDAVMLIDWTTLIQEAQLVDSALKQENPGAAPYFTLYALTISIFLMDHTVALGLELDLFCSEYEIAVVYWYRDYLLSSLITQLSTIRQLKNAHKAAEAQMAEAKSKIQRGKKKGGKHNKKAANTVALPTAEDIEDDYEFLLMNLRRGLCRGTVRFMAAVNQAGLIKEIDFEFTSKEKIFEKRFEAFQVMPQPPPLTYADYKQGSDFSSVDQKELLNSASECFKTSKTMVDKLESQLKVIDSDFVSASENDLRQLAKICVGNTIYLAKLTQMVAENGKSSGGLAIDMETSVQFCTIKIT
ncbi:unnamed protein product [Cylindrotheca closterium]|uniref:N-alpha-acetyltransferase 35, NatC auxiliary subunit n=1 Tax=Cylindrotheca closterium TaxID=2856 RepID=A0AAD2PY02_9STRA|nr:unnamed protein product [Cylindrotheca closterium]